MIDDTGLKAHRTAAGLLKGAGSLTFSGAQKVKLKLDPIYDGRGRDHPFVIRLCEGQMSGYKSGALTLPVLPG
jgi:hypothetical protein